MSELVVLGEGRLRSLPEKCAAASFESTNIGLSLPSREAPVDCSVLASYGGYLRTLPSVGEDSCSFQIDP